MTAAEFLKSGGWELREGKTPESSTWRDPLTGNWLSTSIALEIWRGRRWREYGATMPRAGSIEPAVEFSGEGEQS